MGIDSCGAVGVDDILLGDGRSSRDAVEVGLITGSRIAQRGVAESTEADAVGLGVLGSGGSEGTWDGGRRFSIDERGRPVVAD